MFPLRPPQRLSAMLPRHLTLRLGVVVGAILLFGSISAAAQEPVRLVVKDRVLNEVDGRLFGHFLERPSWGGETGPEAAADSATGALGADVVRLLETMEIPVFRFPGGTDVDHMDWTDMIDAAPGRAAGEGRPTSVGHGGDRVTNAFGYDEALRLAERLGAEMILVVNLGDALLDRKSVDEAACHAAGLVAYANAEVGQPLPEGMPDWPALRARNGHPEPYDVRYFEIGNEVWLFEHPDSAGRLFPRRGDVAPEAKDAYFRAVGAYADAMRAVDPDIEIVVDGDAEGLTQDVRERLGDRVQYLAHHLYYPWAISDVMRDGERVAPGDLEPTPAQAAWYAWASPHRTDADGLASLEGDDLYAAIVEAGYPVAVTEWNWNGWWQGDSLQGLPTSKMAQALGAAGYVHAFMRAGEHVEIALQSMLVGRSWGITSVRYDPSTGESRRFPTGLMTAFYGRHHGDERIELAHGPLPTYVQPYAMGGIRPDTVALLDPVATRRGDTVYVHVINRHLSDALPLVIDATAYGEVASAATHYVFSGSPDNVEHAEPGPAGTREIAYVDSSRVRFDGGELRVEAPPHAISTFAFVARPTSGEGAPEEK